MTMTRFLAQRTSGRTSVVFFKSAKSRTHRAAFAASCPVMTPWGTEVSGSIETKRRNGLVARRTEVHLEREVLLHFFAEPGELEGREDALDGVQQERRRPHVDRGESVALAAVRRGSLTERHPPGDSLFQVRMHALDRDLPPRLALDRAVHLRETRDADRFRVERGEKVRHRGAGLGEEELLQLFDGGREALVLERAHGF